MPRFTVPALLFAGVLVAGGLNGCSSSTSSVAVTSKDAGSSVPAVYVPYPSDFCNYATSWTKYVEPDAGGDGIITPSSLADGGFIHTGGGRTEYVKFLNGPPAHGATEFPVGTIIVKTIDAQQQIFAMAKVGGGYNPNLPDGGPLNWEWLELPAGDCPVDFVWSGAEPPMNQAYGGTPQACNDCHSGYPENDYVASPKILLKGY
jgi:hypothetical protein